MLTINNIHKIDNYQWEIQQGGIKWINNTELGKGLKSCYEIRITKRTDEVNGIPRRLLMQIIRRGTHLGWYSINVFEGGEPVKFIQKKREDITMECIKGIIESV